MLEKFERIKLGHFPTPIEHLKNITKYLGGPNIFIKRDDCTGLATGGNKTRKLEFLMPDAINKKFPEKQNQSKYGILILSFLSLDKTNLYGIIATFLTINLTEYENNYPN